MKTVSAILAPPRRASGPTAASGPGLLATFGPLFRRHRPLLDLRTLSDHLKRDIGALDGNDPRGPRP